MSAIRRAWEAAKRTAAPPAAPKPTPRRSSRLAAQRPVYDATENSRQTADWTPVSGNAGSLTAAHLEQIRARSRDLSRTAPHVTSAFQAIVDNVVGCDGFRVMPRPLEDPTSRGQAEAIDEDLARQLRDLWTEHSSAIDVDRRESLTQMLRLALREYPEGGEAFLVERTPRAPRRFEVPQILELVPSEHLDHGLSSFAGIAGPRIGTGNMLRHGIEFDRDGRRVSYHFRQFDAWGFPELATTPVAASRVHHLFHRLRIGQERGLPWLYSSALIARDLDDLIDAELTSAQVAACLSAFVKSEASGAIFDSDDVETDATDGRPVTRFEPGMVAYLNNGEDITIADPNRPGSAFEPFCNSLVRTLSKALGPAYETVSGDYRQTNFASGRLAHLTERKAFRRIQDDTRGLVVRPIYRSFVARAMLAGLIEIDPTAYAANPRAFDAAQITGPGWEHADPLKEATAAALRILVGLTTLELETNTLGTNWRDNIVQRGKELAEMEKAGLPLFTVGGAQPLTAMTGANSTTRLEALSSRLGFATGLELIESLEDGAINAWEAANKGRNGHSRNGATAHA